MWQEPLIARSVRPRTQSPTEDALADEISLQKLLDSVAFQLQYPPGAVVAETKTSSEAEFNAMLKTLPSDASRTYRVFGHSSLLGDMYLAALNKSTDIQTAFFAEDLQVIQLSDSVVSPVTAAHQFDDALGIFVDVNDEDDILSFGRPNSFGYPIYQQLIIRLRTAVLTRLKRIAEATSALLEVSALPEAVLHNIIGPYIDYQRRIIARPSTRQKRRQSYTTHSHSRT